jgi:hypothetical protein
MNTTGKFSRYMWIECSSGSSMSVLLEQYPDFITGKCLVISSFDSGPLRATSDELARGWKQAGDLVIVPYVSEVSELPYDQYDEWALFTSYVEPSITDTFVNSGLFQLRSPSSLVEEALAATPVGADLAGARYRSDLLAERQHLFWHQMLRTNPESWVGNGERFMFVTQNAEYFERVSNLMKCSEQ